MKFDRKSQYSALFILAFGSLTAFSALRLGLGTINQPEAGFLPFYAAILLVILSLFLLLGSLGKKSFTDTPRNMIQYRKIIFIIACLLGYSLLLDILGFYLITFSLMFMLFFVESRKIRFALLGGILVILCVYVLFQLLLGVYFPKGILAKLG